MANSRQFTMEEEEGQEEAYSRPYLNPYADKTWEHPVKAVHRAWDKTKKKDKKDFPVDKMKQLLLEFLTNVDLCGQQCRDLHNRNVAIQQCGGCLRQCFNMFFCHQAQELRYPQIVMGRVISALYDFAIMTKKEQDICLLEAIRHTHAVSVRFDGILTVQEKMLSYLMPGCKDIFLCKNAYSHLFGIGKDRWKSICCLALDKGPESLLRHGLEGKRGNNYNPHYDVLLHEFFQTIKEFAFPRATQFVRSITNQGKVSIELRDKEEDLLELPSCYSKRSLYNRLVHNCGWKHRTDALGREVVEPISNDTEDNPPIPCPSWYKFWTFWNESYPQLILTRPREDICSECYIFANQYKYCQPTTTSNDSGQGDDSIDAAMEAIKKQEQVVLKAAEHVKAADIQRQLFQKKTDDAIATKHYKPEDRVYCFVADYSQNLYLPNFAQEQPGETYYYSPLNYNAFGVVDCSTKPTELACYVYHEGEGKKGGNNVASMLFAELKRQKLISDDTNASVLHKAKEINIVFDNCSGQNKNRMVLRFILWLVAKGVCKVARAIFLVRGHTKNHCDRMFNLLKNSYRKSNIYVPSDLVQCIGKQQHVSVIDYECIQFYDWDEAFDKHLKRLSETLVNHIFEIDETESTTMKTQLYDGQPVKTQKLLKKESIGTDWANNLQLNIIPEPGLQDIKRLELFDKWRLLVPFHKRSQWKYYYEAPDLTMRSKVKGHKDESKKQRSERSRTADFLIHSVL
mgnify:CR=1 FL=1